MGARDLIPTLPPSIFWPEIRRWVGRGWRGRAGGGQAGGAVRPDAAPRDSGRHVDGPEPPDLPSIMG